MNPSNEKPVGRERAKGSRNDRSRAGDQESIKTEIAKQSEEAKEKLLKKLIEKGGDKRLVLRGEEAKEKLLGTPGVELIEGEPPRLEVLEVVLVFHEKLTWIIDTVQNPSVLIPEDEFGQSELYVDLASESNPWRSPEGEFPRDDVLELAKDAQRARELLQEIPRKLNHLWKTNAAKALRREKGSLGSLPVLGPPGPPEEWEPDGFAEAREQLELISKLPEVYGKFLKPATRTPDLDGRLLRFVNFIRDVTGQPHISLIVQLLRHYQVPHCETEEALEKWLQRVQASQTS